MLELPADAAVAISLHRLLYANVISALEAYLSDTFINRVLRDADLIRRFIETSPEFRRRTISYSEVFKAADESKSEAERYLLDLVWHNLAKVQAMYQRTLRVDLKLKLPDVARALPKRHDIVHRNGRGKDGAYVAVTSDDVKGLVQAVEELVSDIERQLQGGLSDF